jgi:hypothetical protein
VKSIYHCASPVERRRALPVKEPPGPPRTTIRAVRAMPDHPPLGERFDATLDDIETYLTD